jgi:lysophospholipase L1-like esterase
VTLRWIPVLVLAQLGSLGPIEAQPKGQERWVATWATAQTLVRPAAPANITAQSNTVPAPAANLSGPATTPQAIGARGFNNQTVRMMVRTSIGGRRLRVRLSNAFGSAPVVLGAAHLAIRAKDSGIVPDSDRPLSFNGKPGCTIGPGVVLFSDPVDLNVAPVTELAVSLYFPGETRSPTTHATALHNTYISKEGDMTAKVEIAEPVTTQSYYWLAGIDVMAAAQAAVLVTFGDSITDGARSTSETNHSWPALLAARLAANKKTAQIGVANMGIGGNRVLRDGSGASALARFDRDVLGQPGVKWVALMEGINDIGREASVPAEAVTADELIGAYKQLIEQAHTHGVQVIGCTLTPYEGANYSRETGEAVRAALNAWIRTGGAFDAVVDFEAATRDAANPKRLRAEFDPGDHLHPNDAGYQAMADAFDLSIFTRKTARKK